MWREKNALKNTEKSNSKNHRQELHRVVTEERAAREEDSTTSRVHDRYCFRRKWRGGLNTRRGMFPGRFGLVA